MNWQLVFLGSAVTACATGLGALPALGLRYLSARANNVLMGFSAGIMLSASSFSLIVPSLHLAADQTKTKFYGAALVGAAVLLGATFLFLCNRLIPHEHFISGREGGPSSIQLKRIWLFVMAITLHNFPEGLAVGSGVGSQSLSLALPIVAGIGLQDMPEGFIVAAALMSVGYTKWQSVFVAVITGVVEAIAALFGFIATSFFQPLLPWMLAFAGGAMIYVVVEEMIPEIQTKRISSDASGGLLVGFVLMMVLDVALSV
ncbi:MAG: ZIP family metal transporter [Bdellovibrio sp. CG10_big_fil_rev_8_21_14_0_10_47_8]|nr:MAG: ZIP family metal transporter [Bdellovibrio sp. CG10_big_fil_rev_8_21_14_0_10_47_8]